MQKGFAPIFIVLLIVVLGAAISGAYYFGILRTNPQPVYSPNPTITYQTPHPSQSSISSSTPTPSLTENINNQCNQDADCTAVDVTLDLSNPRVTVCTNYDSKNVVGVNSTWLQQQWGGKTCNIAASCIRQVTDSRKTHDIKCINSVCQKVQIQ